MNEQILEKMQKMRLHGMARIFQNSLEKSGLKLLTPDEMVAHLVEAEWDDRYNRKLDRSLHRAHFRYKAAIEQIAFEENRALDKNQVLRLAECTFIKKKENVLITGSTGVGKSFVASALGHQACSLGYKVMYSHSTKLFAKLKLAKADGTYLKELSKMEKQDLLLIDDFGIQPLDAQSRTSLMEIIEDRHGKSSTMFTSQVPIGMWHEVIGEQTIADAILDRIVHDSHRLEMKGESMRKRKSTMTELTN
ncbi:MAG TPA: IS21-like element helper ATPase IstB [Chitinophagales bacterium]|nr:IS21-like element helper ATPase IstB [Chitinophagales bacterium]HNA14850.1 IS21-like element helper ATPase IstB [Cyclobacteriaceae bacterium]